MIKINFLPPEMLYLYVEYLLVSSIFTRIDLLILTETLLLKFIYFVVCLLS
jgi:hypothetical protein